MASFQFEPGLTGDEIQRRLEVVSYLEQLVSEPVGIQWDSTSSVPTLQRIDINGDKLSVSSSYFNNHVLFGGIVLCARNRDSGSFIYFDPNNPDDFIFDGSTGYDLFAEYPIARLNTAIDGDFYQWTIIPYNTPSTRYPISPMGVQRGGNEHSKIYIGAKEASLRIDSSGNKVFASVSNAQPFTGGTIYSITFSDGLNVFTKGETVTGTTSLATGIVVDFYTSSGAWGSNAAGILYLRATSGTFQSGESITGSVTGSATTTSIATSLSLTVSEAEGYANALGEGFGICNLYTYADVQLRMLIEYGTFDIQSALGAGVTTRASGSGYNGVLTGADSIDTQLKLTTNGTGSGTGVSGNTPVAYRWLENIPGGNIWEYVIGLNMYTDGSCHILPNTGTVPKIIPATLSDYEVLSGVPHSANGYITGISSSPLGMKAFIPSANTGGSSSTWLCDQFFIPTASPSVVQYGGSWNFGLSSGINCRSAASTLTGTNRTIGARIEYYPQ